ncbi:asparaginyl-trna synthetase (nob+trna synthase), partial [Cystoisospora suis]
MFRSSFGRPFIFRVASTSGKLRFSSSSSFILFSTFFFYSRLLFFPSGASSFPFLLFPSSSFRLFLSSSRSFSSSSFSSPSFLSSLIGLREVSRIERREQGKSFLPLFTLPTEAPIPSPFSLKKHQKYMQTSLALSPSLPLSSSTSSSLIRDIKKTPFFSFVLSSTSSSSSFSPSSFFSSSYSLPPQLHLLSQSPSSRLFSSSRSITRHLPSFSSFLQPPKKRLFSLLFPPHYRLFSTAPPSSSFSLSLPSTVMASATPAASTSTSSLPPVLLDEVPSQVKLPIPVYGCGGSNLGRTRIAALVDCGDASIERFVGEGKPPVTVCGWSRSVRKQGGGSLCFVVLNDGSSVSNLQVVVESSIGGDFEKLLKCGAGCSFKFIGDLVKSPAKGQAVEMQVK